jgi:hypothetical protein
MRAGLELERAMSKLRQRRLARGRHIFRLYGHPPCGLRTWTLDDDEPPTEHRNPHTGEPCTDPLPVVLLMALHST